MRSYERAWDVATEFVSLRPRFYQMPRNNVRDIGKAETECHHAQTNVCVLCMTPRACGNETLTWITQALPIYTTIIWVSLVSGYIIQCIRSVIRDWNNVKRVNRFKFILTSFSLCSSCIFIRTKSSFKCKKKCALLLKDFFDCNPNRLQNTKTSFKKVQRNEALADGDA